MRILTVTNMYPTERSPQFGIFVEEQVNSIRALGHDVDVLFVNAREGRLRHKAYVLGFPRLWQVLSKNRYDVIHAHYVFSGVIARAQRSTPLVLTHHGPEFMHPWQGPLCRLTKRWPDELIVVASWMLPILSMPRVHLIPCGVDFSLFRPMDRQEARTKLGLDPSKRYVLFAGNSWDRRKRFDLVQAARRMVSARQPDVELLEVCGQPHHLIPLYMNAADVFAMVSTSEGSAQVVKEAMACNLPIVATDAGDNWEVIDGTAGCHRTGADPAEIAARLEGALSPPRRTDGRSKVERFSMESTARAVVTVYEQALRSSSEPARSETLRVTEVP